MMPLPATLFLGYAMLGGALFLFSAGLRAFLQESDVPVLVESSERRRHATSLAPAVVSLFLATLLLLAATIALLTVAPELI